MMKKVTKAQVKAIQKRLETWQHLEVTLFPSNCGPSNTVWVKGYTVTLGRDGVWDAELKEFQDFESIVNSFSYYNCNAELGKRVHYYIEEAE